jgi:monofunctional biosynthetic peptidoglycan transglycosylase
MRAVRAVLLAVVAAVVLAVGWLFLVWPPPSWYRSHFPAKTAFMRLRERQARASRDTTSRRYLPVPLDSITEWLPRAATAGEDEAFYQHHGIDWHSLRQALGYRRDNFDWSSSRDRSDLSHAIHNAGARRDKLRGASTITQQLAKNLYLSPSRNPLRKVKEAVIAYRLEWALPKDRIMELYLSTAELGHNVWGAEAASQTYFGRSAGRLSLEQAALLVATLPHPLSSNPSLHPGRTLWRQQLILRKLRGENVVVPPEVDETEAPRRADSVPPAPDTVNVPADTPRIPVDSAPLPVDTPRVFVDTTKKPDE